MKPERNWIHQRYSGTHVMLYTELTTWCVWLDGVDWRWCITPSQTNHVLHSGTADTLEAAQLAAEQAARAVLQAELERLG